MNRIYPRGPNKIYLNLAKDLTAKGIATFRYDKRNYAYGNEYLIKSNVDKKVSDDIASWINKINTSFKGVKNGWNSYDGIL